jgi:lipopolysaccharide export system permease protein
MGHIDRYISKVVLGGILLVFTVLLCLDILFSLIDQLDDMEQDYQVLQVIWYTLMSTPTRLYEYIPIATLIGCLAGMGMLANTSELTAIRAAGLSVYRIIGALTLPLTLVMLLGLALGEYAVPYLERTSNTYREIAQGGNDVHDNKDIGYWHKESNTYMRFNAIEPSGIIHGITLYLTNPDQRITAYITAKKATYRLETGWILEQVEETLFNDDLREFTRKQIDQTAWQTALTPENLKFVAQSPAYMAMSTLYRYADYLEKEGIKADEYRLAFWKKIFQPLSILALILVGASFIFGPLRSVTMGQRLITGILVGIGYKFSVDLFGPAGVVLGISPMLANLMPIVICAAIGLWLLRRVG